MSRSQAEAELGRLMDVAPIEGSTHAQKTWLSAVFSLVRKLPNNYVIGKIAEATREQLTSVGPLLILHTVVKIYELDDNGIYTKDAQQVTTLVMCVMLVWAGLSSGYAVNRRKVYGALEELYDRSNLSTTQKRLIVVISHLLDGFLHAGQELKNFSLAFSVFLLSILSLVGSIIGIIADAKPVETGWYVNAIEAAAALLFAMLYRFDATTDYVRRRSELPPFLHDLLVLPNQLFKATERVEILFTRADLIRSRSRRLIYQIRDFLSASTRLGFMATVNHQSLVSGWIIVTSILSGQLPGNVPPSLYEHYFQAAAFGVGGGVAVLAFWLRRKWQQERSSGLYLEDGVFHLEWGADRDQTIKKANFLLTWFDRVFNAQTSFIFATQLALILAESFLGGPEWIPIVLLAALCLSSTLQALETVGAHQLPGRRPTAVPTLSPQDTSMQYAIERDQTSFADSYDEQSRFVRPDEQGYRSRYSFWGPLDQPGNLSFMREPEPPPSPRQAHLNLSHL